MSKTTTLCEFLEDTGAKLRFYEMGRRVCEIPRDEFLRFEKTEIPYSQPLHQKAWFALVQLRPDFADEPIIWFLRFDLDEQGKLILATRDYFIHRFVELAAENTQADLGAALEDNPFTFKPREDKMANLNAVLNRDLGRSPSQYFDHAREYFAGELGWDQWNFLGYQGIADMAARHAEPSIDALLTKSLPRLPAEPLVALSQCLENQEPSPSLSRVLKARLVTEIASNEASVPTVAALLRSLSRTAPELRTEAVRAVLEKAVSSDPEILAAIGGRAWESLSDEQTLHAYVERLASEGVDQNIFNHCLADLMRLPGLRDKILNELRSPQRSENVAQAFQKMLG